MFVSIRLLGCALTSSHRGGLIVIMASKGSRRELLGSTIYFGTGVLSVLAVLLFGSQKVSRLSMHQDSLYEILAHYQDLLDVWVSWFHFVFVLGMKNRSGHRQSPAKEEESPRKLDIA